ncbi:MAG: S8 family peptidase [Candidatus Nitrospinota bacterium M3_3B_026]
MSLGENRARTLLAVCALLIIAWSCGPAPSGEPESSALSTAAAKKRTAAQDYSRLFAAARQTGSARVIVRLDMGFRPEGEIPASQAADQQAAIQQKQDALLNSMAGQNISAVKRFQFIPHMAMVVDEHALNGLVNNPHVAAVEEDYLAEPIQAAPSLYDSGPHIGADNAWAAGYTGAGQTVAILDTGVAKTHSFLSGKVVSEACYSHDGSGYTSLCPGGVTSSTASGAGVNCDVATYGAACEHGTHVAGIAAGKDGVIGGTTFHGIGKDASVIAIQVFSHRSSDGAILSWFSDQISAMERVYALRGSYNIASVNMSLGGGRYYDQTTCDANNSATKAAIDTLRSVDIATVIASGNDYYKDSLSAPGCISTAVSVGATGYNYDTVAGFSNSASFLSLLAPGVYIYSSVPGGGFTYKSGTSMATPHVAGAWAVMRHKFPSLSVSGVLSRLQSTGVSVTDTNGVTKPRIQLDTALNFAPAALTSHAGGDTLTGSSVTFTWNSVAGADAYSIYVGTSQGAYDIYDHYMPGLPTSDTVTGLPVDGSTVYVRLWTRIGGVWYYNDYTFTAYTAGAAALTSHAGGDTLTGSSVTFTWNSVAGADAYSIYVGTSQGAYDIYDHYMPGLPTSDTVTGLPVDGSTVYVRLWTRIGGVWYYNDYTFTAATV